MYCLNPSGGSTEWLSAIFPARRRGAGGLPVRDSGVPGCAIHPETDNLLPLTTVLWALKTLRFIAMTGRAAES